AARRRCPHSAAARAHHPPRCRWRRRHAAGAGRAQDSGAKRVEPRRRRRLRAPRSDPETAAAGGCGRARAPPRAPARRCGGARAPSGPSEAVREERVRMTRLRQTIARRLKEAQNTAAMLTTFNDVDMSVIMKMRSDYKEPFEKRHHVKLGFMAFFVKASIQAL